MSHAVKYADKLVLRYCPRAIVLHEGGNDIAQKVSPVDVADNFRKFVKKVHNKFPQCRIYFLSIRPSIARDACWKQMEDANILIEEECSRDKRLMFVDVASCMLDDEGKAKREYILEDDDLHMTRAAYIKWTSILEPILMKTEYRFEPKDGCPCK